MSAGDEQLAERVDELEETLAEILRTFVPLPGPGQQGLRTSFVEIGAVARWQQVLARGEKR